MWMAPNQGSQLHKCYASFRWPILQTPQPEAATNDQNKNSVLFWSRTKDFYIQQRLESRVTMRFFTPVPWILLTFCDLRRGNGEKSISEGHKSKWSFWERRFWLPRAMNTWTWCTCLFLNPAIKSVPMQQDVESLCLSVHGKWSHSQPNVPPDHSPVLHSSTPQLKDIRCRLRKLWQFVEHSSSLFSISLDFSQVGTSGPLYHILVLKTVSIPYPQTKLSEFQRKPQQFWQLCFGDMWRCLASPKSINGSLGGSLKNCLYETREQRYPRLLQIFYFDEGANRIGDPKFTNILQAKGF